MKWYHSGNSHAYSTFHNELGITCIVFVQGDTIWQNVGMRENHCLLQTLSLLLQITDTTSIRALSSHHHIELSIWLQVKYPDRDIAHEMP